MEFWQAFPSLYQQAQDRQPDENWSIKAPLVAHLERGIEKMQHEAGLSRSSTTPSSINKSHGKVSGGDGALKSGPPQYTGYPRESHGTRAKGYARKDAEDDHTCYYHQSQHLDMWKGAEPTLHKSSSSSTLRGTASEEPSPGNPNTTRSAATPTVIGANMGSSTGSAHLDRRGRSSLFTRIIRSGKPDTPSSR